MNAVASSRWLIAGGREFCSENRANGPRVRATNTPTRRSLSAHCAPQRQTGADLLPKLAGLRIGS